VKAFEHTSGPQDARVVFVGEAWGREEDALKRPFVGASGREFWRMLGECYSDIDPPTHAFAAQCGGALWVREREAWLTSASMLFTNVLALRPQNNDLDTLCVSKKELPEGYRWPAIKIGRYVHPEVLEPQVERLKQELLQTKPNLVVALGNMACLALLKRTGIGSIRGTVSESTLVPGLKVLPTYHPAAIMRLWANRPIVLADLLKARREWQRPEITRPIRWIVTDPSIEDIEQWYEVHFRVLPRAMAIDIETRFGQIECIGFAPSRSHALVIPFIDYRKPGWSYWPQGLEMIAWQWVRRLCSLPIPKVFQNGIFDIQYIWKMGIPVTQMYEDTMLLHHSMYPEMLKGLGFLGSVYSNEPAWKLMRQGRKTDALKKDE
jgi:uracil-DNA glycosylase